MHRETTWYIWRAKSNRGFVDIFGGLSFNPPLFF